MSAPPRRTGRLRRATGLTLHALCLLSVAAWWGSQRWSLAREDVPRYVLARGAIHRQRIAVGEVGWFVRDVDDHPRVIWRAPTEYHRDADAVYDYWLFSYSEGKFPPACWTLVLWPFPPLLFVAGCAALWPDARAIFRRRSGRCDACGYSLTGIQPHAPCPECGARGVPDQPCAH